MLLESICDNAIIYPYFLSQFYEQILLNDFLTYCETRAETKGQKLKGEMKLKKM